LSCVFALIMRGCGWGSTWCGGNCGERYWGDFYNDPPDCCDPCDCHGNFTGGGCSHCGGGYAGGYSGGSMGAPTGGGCRSCNGGYAGNQGGYNGYSQGNSQGYNRGQMVGRMDDGGPDSQNIVSESDQVVGQNSSAVVQQQPHRATRPQANY
jgi:hypothetical protein